eukprot:Gregarina_sp_Poly_1__3701@NODE_2093_length_2692_cov_42_825143_g1350_i0_p2_GENE_NODE_2093_length_2692_cov_42_825143_g1350_i0NODE_2093_length_2692_cov_42_825143_g1350_i0_p2_ORF_typecomplete_len124_score16_09_NODE_2093_length_2692_cov_42_825143_g1350_i0464835
MHVLPLTRHHLHNTIHSVVALLAILSLPININRLSASSPSLFKPPYLRRTACSNVPSQHYCWQPSLLPQAFTRAALFTPLPVSLQHFRPQKKKPTERMLSTVQFRGGASQVFRPPNNLSTTGS